MSLKLEVEEESKEVGFPLRCLKILLLDIIICSAFRVKLNLNVALFDVSVKKG